MENQKITWKFIGKPGRIVGECLIFEFKTMENHVETIEQTSENILNIYGKSRVHQLGC